MVYKQKSKEPCWQKNQNEGFSEFQYLLLNANQHLIYLSLFPGKITEKNIEEILQRVDQI